MSNHTTVTAGVAPDFIVREDHHPENGTLLGFWMYLMSERVMLNKASMRKFGLRLGDVTLSFYKR